MELVFRNVPSGKVNALRSQLTWTHYRLLLKVEKVEAGHFYMLEAVENGSSIWELEIQKMPLFKKVVDK
ncbi:MAG: DUF1016 domain-containing protein [bacterium]|nr:DUF1016 domain-containing protein [bacterium]